MVSKISIEELEAAGRLQTLDVKIDGIDYQIVKYRAPLGRSGKHFIRVLQAGQTVSNTKNILGQIFNTFQFPAEQYNENTNILGDRLLVMIPAKIKEMQEAQRQEELRKEQQRQQEIQLEQQRLQQQRAEEERQRRLAEEKERKARALAEQEKRVKEAAAQEKARKANLDLEEQYAAYSKIFDLKTVKQQEEAELKVLEQNRKFKLPSKMTWISIASLFVAMLVGGGLSANATQLQQQRDALKQVEKQLNHLDKSEVSKETKAEIKKELSDTNEIIKAKSLDNMKAESSRLEALSKKASGESSQVQELLQRAVRLESQSSKEDKDQLSDWEKKASDYSSISSYSSDFTHLMDLVEAHNNRTTSIASIDKILADKDLSKANKKLLTDDIQKLKKASTTDDITSLIGKLSTDSLTAQNQIEDTVTKRKEDEKKAAEAQAAAEKAAKEKAAQEAAAAAEAKKKADEEAAAQAAAQKKAADDAAAQAAQDAQNAQAAAPASSGYTTSAGWANAESGMCFYRPDSGKYYVSVKNPGNYQYISISEAASMGGTPGHSNGSARN
ncbi:hypothetical protein [Lactococcus termiticola]|uniref:Prophage protein n=1 Tax=Lactococcus termiticola TaxID=2169526 RepID=A0A2R5HGW6_9LACT|nr:hypothetical protein [Lactococcus termiticola]GBG97279.1 prophage protein [Lactococcus termiticola]